MNIQKGSFNEKISQSKFKLTYLYSKANFPYDKFILNGKQHDIKPGSQFLVDKGDRFEIHSMNLNSQRVFTKKIIKKNSFLKMKKLLKINTKYLKKNNKMKKKEALILFLLLNISNFAVFFPNSKIFHLKDLYYIILSYLTFKNLLISKNIFFKIASILEIGVFLIPFYSSIYPSVKLLGINNILYIYKLSKDLNYIIIIIKNMFLFSVNYFYMTFFQ